MANRLGVPSAERSEMNFSGNSGCPDIFQVMKCDDIEVRGTEGMAREPVFAVIGTLATADQMGKLQLPADASVAEHEGMVFVPAEVLLAAARELLDVDAPKPAVTYA
jgi:hypothetical protein